MNRTRTLVILLVSFLLASPLPATAGVDEESIFQGARESVSQLDLQLSNIQRSWNQQFFTPSEETKREHPLISQADVTIQLNYYRNDRISAIGWITKLDGFLKLSASERKQLVSNTLELVKSRLGYPTSEATLVDKKTGSISGRMLENRHIVLSMIINKVTRTDKNENIRLFLPSGIGVGQAGYKDGQFVFSETYFLNLQVHDGVAVSGDPNKFIIEKER